MGLRELLNGRPAVTAVLSMALVIAAMWIVVRWRAGERRLQEAAAAAMAAGINTSYFTTDDGASYFEDSGANLPPYKKDGKTAYGAAVFRCGDGEPFVAYLIRYSDEYKAALAEALGGKQMDGGDGTRLQRLAASGVEIKRPGEQDWVVKAPDYLAGPPQSFGRRQMQQQNPTPADVVCPEGQEATQVQPASRPPRPVAQQRQPAQ